MKQEREDEVGWEVAPSLITKETYEKSPPWALLAGTPTLGSVGSKENKHPIKGVTGKEDTKP